MLCNQLLGLGLEFPPQASPDSGRLCILGIFLSLRVPSWEGQTAQRRGRKWAEQARPRATKGCLGRWQVALTQAPCGNSLGSSGRPPG